MEIKKFISINHLWLYKTLQIYYMMINHFYNPIICRYLQINLSEYSPYWNRSFIINKGINYCLNKAQYFNSCIYLIWNICLIFVYIIIMTRYNWILLIFDTTDQYNLLYECEGPRGNAHLHKFSGEEAEGKFMSIGNVIY